MGRRKEERRTNNESKNSPKKTLSAGRSESSTSLSQREDRMQVLDLVDIAATRGPSDGASDSNNLSTGGRPRLAQEESSCSSGAAQPKQPPRRRHYDHGEGRGKTKVQDSLSCSQSVMTTESEREGMSTLDLVIGKRYASLTSPESDRGQLQTPTLKRGDASNPVMLEAGTGVLVDHLVSGNKLDLWDRWRRTAGGPSGTNNNFGSSSEKRTERREVYFERSDGSMSTIMPDPPSLHQRGHYAAPGAFRMSSGGTNDDVESLIDSVTSYPTVGRRNASGSPAIVEASLVYDDQVPSDDYPPIPASAFTVSMGGNTLITTDTTTTTKASPIVEAIPLDEIQTVKAFFSTRKVKCFLLALTVVFVILALGTAYGVNGFQQSRLSKDSSASYYDDPPTNPPTTEGDLELEYFLKVAIPDYTRSALRLQNSPQSKALSWLGNNTFLGSYDLSRRMQRFSLATFYFSTGGDRRWDNNSGWLSDDHECTWFFSTDQIEGNFEPCDNNTLTRFSLVENNMRGTFPLEISFLSSLEVLEMPRNVLTGFLPTTLGQMSILRSVHLFDNYLSGTVPSEIGDASSLEVFDVEYNLMAQLLPETLGRLSNLKELLLDRNLLRGNIPIEFARLSNLETFYLFSNSFSGTIPTEVGYLSNLRSIRWEVNRLSGNIPTEIGLLENVVDLSIGNNTLRGSIPSEIGALSQLSYCDLFWNFLSGTIPTEIGRLTNVERMYFERNRLEGPIPSELGNMKRLSRLWLYSNALTGTLPSDFGRLSNSITNLDVSFNDISGSLPTEIARLTNIESLSLEFNSFTGRIPSELGRLTKLSLLALHENFFTGTIPYEICLLKAFGSLDNIVVDCSMVTCDCCVCSSDLE